MSKTISKIRNNAVVDFVYNHLWDAISAPGWGGFHGDRVYQGLMRDLIETIRFSSFVETGTFRGHSTAFIAVAHPTLPIFTVEVVESTHKRARRYVSRFPNITPLLGSSDAAVKQLIADHHVGALPLYYLDAHWQTYWPLRDELRSISEAGGKAIIVIDDFEIPGQPQFGFDIDGGGAITQGHNCNFDYIRPALGETHRYQSLYPRYTMADAFDKSAGPLRGHIVLFQNMPDEFSDFLQRPIVKNHYFHPDTKI